MFLFFFLSRTLIQGSVSDPSAVPLNLRPKLLDGPEGSSSFGDALSSLRVCFVADPLVSFVCVFVFVGVGARILLFFLECRECHCLLVF